MYRKLFNIAKFTFLALAVTTANALAWTPFIDILSPPSAAPGSGPLSLTIHGANFIPGAIVNFNGVKLTPDSLTISQMHVTVPAASLATAHTANVTVVNPDTAPLNGSSNVAFFPITIATPSVSISSTLTIPNLGPAVAVGDFNGDGKLDLALNGLYFSTGSQVDILLGDGAGHFSTASTPSAGVSGIGSIVTGDFNGDGILDLAILGANYDFTTNVTSPILTVLLGDGTGQFTSASFPVPELVNATPLVTGDLNGDGKLDLAVATININGIHVNSNVYILENAGGGNFVVVSDSTLGFQVASLTPGDFNGDGKLDLEVVGYNSGQNRDVPTVGLLLGDGGGNFSYSSQYQDIQSGIAFLCAAAGDFNGDGKLDLAVCDSYNDRLIVFLNDGMGNLAIASLPQPGFIQAVVTADFNGDGKLDLAAASNSNYFTILLGDGAGNFIPVASPQENPPTDIVLGDFNGSGRLDFVVPSPLAGTVSILFDPASATSALDVTSSFSVVSTGLIYSRVTQSYHGTITVTNTGTQTYTGPLELTFQNLPSEVSLTARSGTFQGAPYLNLPGGLAPGQSVSLTLQFSDPSNTAVTFTNKIYSGTL